MVNSYKQWREPYNKFQEEKVQTYTESFLHIIDSYNMINAGCVSGGGVATLPDNSTIIWDKKLAHNTLYHKIFDCQAIGQLTQLKINLCFDKALYAVATFSFSLNCGYL